MSNEERKQLNDDVKALGSVLRDLGQQLIPRVQAFERTLRELIVAAKPYLANLVKNVKALPARTANVQRILARRGWFIPPKDKRGEWDHLVPFWITPDFEGVDQRALAKAITKRWGSSVSLVDENKIAAAMRSPESTGGTIRKVRSYLRSRTKDLWSTGR